MRILNIHRCFSFQRIWECKLEYKKAGDYNQVYSCNCTTQHTILFCSSDLLLEIVPHIQSAQNHIYFQIQLSLSIEMKVRIVLQPRLVPPNHHIALSHYLWNLFDSELPETLILFFQYQFLTLLKEEDHLQMDYLGHFVFFLFIIKVIIDQMDFAPQSLLVFE